jgi:hypothetical protein
MKVHPLSRSYQEMSTKKTMGPDRTSCARACVGRGEDTHSALETWFTG